MKKIILILVSLLILAGCSNANEITTYEEVTTYKEVIEDNKVVIDGISYDIESVMTETITYDKKDRISKKKINNEYFESSSKYSNQTSNSIFEFSYKGKFLIEIKRYQDDLLYSTSSYTYEDNQVAEINEIRENGSELLTSYTYGDGFIKLTFSDSKGETYTSTAYLDENDRIIRSDTDQGNFTSTTTAHYEGDLMIKNILTSRIILTNEINESEHTAHYEYNNVGDKIMTYTTYDGDVNYVKVEFYDYEYNDEMLPTKITKHTVHSPIEKESIRHY